MSDDAKKQENPRKRVQVLLAPDIYDEVEKLSKLGGISVGSLLAELLSDCKPALVMIRETFEAAKKNDLSAAMDRIQSGLLDSVGEGVELSKHIHEERKKIQK